MRKKPKLFNTLIIREAKQKMSRKNHGNGNVEDFEDDEAKELA